MLPPSLSTNTSITNLNTSKTKSLRSSSSFKNNGFNQTLAIQQLNKAENPELITPTKPNIGQISANPITDYEPSKAPSQQAAITDKQEELLYYPDEIRYGRKRPPLPHTFGFGLRRPTTLPLAMRFSVIDGEQPKSAQAAIAATFDLAATNSHPYTKGQRLSLYV